MELSTRRGNIGKMQFCGEGHKVRSDLLGLRCFRDRHPRTDVEYMLVITVWSSKVLTVINVFREARYV